MTPISLRVRTARPLEPVRTRSLAKITIPDARSISAKAMLERNEGITRLRGRWFSFEREGREAIPATAIFHPAFLLRQPARKKETWRDLLAIRARLDAMGLAPAATRPES